MVTLKVQPVLERSSYDIYFSPSCATCGTFCTCMWLQARHQMWLERDFMSGEKCPGGDFLLLVVVSRQMLQWWAGLLFQRGEGSHLCRTFQVNPVTIWNLSKVKLEVLVEHDIDAQSGQALVRVWLPSKVLAGTLASNEQIKRVKFLVDIKCSQTCVNSSNYHLVPFCVDPPHSDYMICCDPMYNLDIPDHYTSTANYAATLAHKVH